MVHGMADSLFLSTPSARRATHQTGGRLCSKSISIHALREEGDRPSGLPLLLSVRFLSTSSARRATRPFPPSDGTPWHFYPRPPRGGRRFAHACRPLFGGFLSTPSARRATAKRCQPSGGKENFYPRPPRGGRHFRLVDVAPSCIFLSTPSARRATRVLILVRGRGFISIHALREEGDAQKWAFEHLGEEHFYPRPPRGGRRRTPRHRSQSREFLSTPSARRATPASRAKILLPLDFYPRPPRGGRRMQMPEIAARRIFLSTPSARRATHAAGRTYGQQVISIHALREEGDPTTTWTSAPIMRFLSTPSARRATRVAFGQIIHHADFYPRPPRGGRLWALSTSAPRSVFLSTPSARRATRTVIAARTSRTDFYPRPPRGGRPNKAEGIF